MKVIYAMKLKLHAFLTSAFERGEWCHSFVANKDKKCNGTGILILQQIISFAILMCYVFVHNSVSFGQGLTCA
jgi:hypothetical protein